MYATATLSTLYTMCGILELYSGLFSVYQSLTVRQITDTDFHINLEFILLKITFSQAFCGKIYFCTIFKKGFGKEISNEMR